MVGPPVLFTYGLVAEPTNERPHNSPKAFRHYLKPRKRPRRSFSRPANVRSTPFALAPECGCLLRPRLTDRVQRLKDARSEAAKEIAAYKASKEQEFKAFEASVRLCLYIPLLGCSPYMGMANPDLT